MTFEEPIQNFLFFQISHYPNFHKPHPQTYHHDDLGRTVAVPKAVISQEAQQAIKYQCGKVARVQQGLHQGNSAHRPVTTKLRGVEQQPGIYWQEVVEGQLPGWGGADSSWIIKPDDRWERINEYSSPLRHTTLRDTIHLEKVSPIREIMIRKGWFCVSPNQLIS